MKKFLIRYLQSLNSSLRGHEFEIEETTERVSDLDFPVNHYDRLKNEVENTDQVCYLADNAGEIVFNRIFLEEMEEKETTFYSSEVVLYSIM